MVPWDTWDSRDPLSGARGLGSLHPAQHDLVLFILRGMWDREHLEAA